VARGGGLGDVILERAGWPAEGSFHAVGERGALAVADGHEEAGEQPRDVRWDAVGDLVLDEDLRATSTCRIVRPVALPMRSATSPKLIARGPVSW